jgi:hypothetical protein
MMISIQDFQDIRKRNIKTYIVELMKNIANGINRRINLEILGFYIDGFKFVLRVIFPEFIKDIIT